MSAILREIHRRSLWQVLGIYVAGSWVTLQVVDTIDSTLGLPHWVPRAAFALLLIGLPVVLATAVVQGGFGSRPAPRPFSDDASSAYPRAASSSAASPTRLTWRNAALAGIGAFALLGLATAAWLSMRALGIGPAGSLLASGVLEEQERILVAEFSEGDGIEDLGDVVTEAFRVDLSQSPSITVVERRFLGDPLSRMGADPSAPLNFETAMELAEREGFKAVVGGGVDRAGQGYQMSARLVSASGETLFSHRETASDESEILEAIERLSERLRERVGESLRSVRAGEPLARVTTPSLDALKKYTRGQHAYQVEGDPVRGLALLEEAVAIDSSFALAHLAIHTTLSNQREQYQREMSSLEDAYRFIDRLTDRERYITLGHYYMEVDGDIEKSISAWMSVLDLHPRDFVALNNAGVGFVQVRDFERGSELFRAAIDAAPEQPIAYMNVSEIEVAVGRFDAAEAVLDEMDRRFPGHPHVPWHRGDVAASQGDFETAEAHIRALREAESGSLRWRVRTSLDLADLAMVRGRLDAAEEHLRDAMAGNEQRQLVGEYLKAAIRLAMLEAWLRGDPDRAEQAITEALDSHPLETVGALDRPYMQLVSAYVTMAQPERAAGFVEAWEEEVEAHLRSVDPWRDQAMGDLALAEGRAAAAIEAYRAWDDAIYCVVCALGALGFAYEKDSQADSALAVYRRYVESRWRDRIETDALWLGPVLERAARLSDETGDTEAAALYYARLVELWAEADPVLQPRVEAARERLQEILEARG